MADRIRGITIELDGETTGLKKALSGVTQQSIDIQKELTDVQRLLKFDPGNTTLLAQKQELLSKQIEITSQKLNVLKNAQSQVDEQFKSGKIGEEQYRSFQREIAFTEASLGKLKQSLAKVDDGSAVKNVKEDMSKIPEEANKAEESVKGLGSELTNLAAGAAAGMGISEIIEKSLDTSSLNTQIDISFNVPPESVQSVKDAISTVETYGVDSEAALEGVRRQWALNKDASDESNAAVVQGAATIVAAYGDIDFTELIQETNEFSKNIGVSNEDAMALYYSLFKIGFPTDQVDIIAEYGTQLKMAGFNAEEIQSIMASGVENGTWNIDNLLDGLGEARKLLTEFGNGIDNTTASLLEGTNISKEQLQAWGQSVASGGEAGANAMQEVSKALLSVEDDTKRNNLGVKIFGTMWEDQGSKVAEVFANMNDNLTTAEENQNNLNAATEALNSDPAVQMQTAVSNLMTALAPLLTVIADVIGKVAEWVANNPTLAATIAAIVATVGILIGIIAGLAPIITMITSILPLLTGGLAAIAAPVLIVIGVITALVAAGVALYANWDLIKAKAAEVWAAISTGVSSFADGVVNFFTVTIPGALASLGEFFSGLWTTISQAFTDGWNSIVTFFTESIPAWIESVGQWFLELPNKIAEALGFALGSIIKWGADVVSWIATEVPKFIENIVNFYLELPGKIWDCLVLVVTKLGEWGSNIVSWIATNVPIWIDNIITFFTELPGKIWTFLVDVVTKVGEWGSNMLTSAKEGMGKVFDGIVETFTNLPSKMMDIGKNIVQGIKDGILKAWEGMTGWIGGLCDSFTEGIKKALDIHSPSRVMRTLGVYTGEGFGLGIGDTVSSISKQANALASAAIPNVNAGSFDMGINAAGGGMGATSSFNEMLSVMSSMKDEISSLKEAFNVTLNLDGQKVGKMITPAVSSNLAFNSGRKGF